MSVKLGSLLKEINIKTTKNNQFPVLTSSKSGIYLQEDYFTKQVASKDNTGYKVIERGQFTYRSMSDNGEFTINRMKCLDKGIVSPAYPVFEIIDKGILDSDYLCYFFKSYVFKKKLELLSQGSTRLSIKFKKICEVDINLPSLAEQKEIAKTLKKLDKIVNTRSEAIQKYDELIKTKFIEMFGTINENPHNYPKKELGEIAYITKLAGFEYSKYINYKDSGQIIMVRGLNCKKGKLILDDVFYEDKATSDLLPRSKLLKGDIVLTYVGTIGECALIDEDDKYHLAPNVAKVSILDKCENIPEFFTAMFVCFRDYIVNFSSATTQPKISMGEIRKIPFIVPPTPLQKEYATFLSKVDKLKTITQKQIDLTNELINVKMRGYFD